MAPRWLGKANDVQPAPGKGPAVLVFDIETTPILGYTWDMYKANVLRVQEPSKLLCFAYKWLGDTKEHWVGLPTYPTRKNRDDRHVVARLWHLFDRADVLVAHNGDRFDIKKAGARFLAHKLPPPAPYRSIDTLKEVRRYAKFGSHRLNSLGVELGLGEKTPHSGMHTWFGCMADNPDAWAIMERYNRQDVRLLEELYLELLPWIGQPGKANPGVNAAAYGDGVRCPKVGCGGTELVGRGYTATAAGLRYRKMQCKKCHGYSQARFAERDLDRPPVK